MRAIKIDPFKREVVSVILPDANTEKGFENVRESLGNPRMISECFLGPDVVMLLDDEGLFLDDQAFFKLAFMQQSHFAGRVMLFGVDPSDRSQLSDSFFTVDQVASTVEWQEPPSTQTMDKLLEITVTPF